MMEHLFMKVTSNHDGLGVTTQAVLEQPGEYGVAVRDEGRLARAVGRRQL